MATKTFFWKRLDSPGHDACRLFRAEDGWQLAGIAAFCEGSLICQLQYDVHVSENFATSWAHVKGFAGLKALNVRVQVDRLGRWRVNGVEQPQLDGLVDIDLGFTPATNLLPLRRLRLRVGEQAEAPAAYFDFPSLRWRSLPQRYLRLSGDEYAYESPRHGYHAVLKVSRDGAVMQYPGVFEMAAARS